MGKEKKRDAAKREKLHAKWLQQQDATDMEAVVAAMRSGWRRPGRNNGLDGDLVRTWQRKFILGGLSTPLGGCLPLDKAGATDMEAVVAAMRSGLRRPGRNNGFDGNLVSPVSSRVFRVLFGLLHGRSQLCVTLNLQMSRHECKSYIFRASDHFQVHGVVSADSHRAGRPNAKDGWILRPWPCAAFFSQDRNIAA